MVEYEVTVAVVTYNPDVQKLLATLRSILCQKNIRFEIVIADDGSIEPGFEFAEQLFIESGFTDYVLVRNKENRGTVWNLFSAIEKSRGRYVKTISPGDLLSDENVLSKWVEKTVQCDAQVSFSDAVYYREENGAAVVVQELAHPQVVSCYLKKDFETARYRYLIYNDLILGAALLCQREVMLRYLQEIVGKVVYAEDHIFRLMAYDRVPICYFPYNAVTYEVGSGISTSGNSVWKQRLQKDWEAATEVLVRRCTGKDMLDPLLLSGKKGSKFYRIMKLWWLVRDRSIRQTWLEHKRESRMTDNQYPKVLLRNH